MRCPHCGNRISDSVAESTGTCPVCKRGLGEASSAEGDQAAASAEGQPSASASSNALPGGGLRSVTAKFEIDSPGGGQTVSRDKAKTPVSKPQASPPPKQQAAKKETIEKLGAFEVRGMLGEGGMGAVYDGYDPQLDRRVAIKVLSPKLAQDSQFVQRFLTEARAVARVSHPNVASVFSAGSDGDRHFFVMEFVDGESLDDKVEKNGRLSPKAAIGYGMQAVRGLAAAYERGIVHRDVKPANLMLNKEDEMKVTDFGLAKLSGQNIKLTQAGSVMGSPHFMAPEQGRGEETDVHADVYSLGATMYYLLTGKPPYEGDTALAVILKHQEAPVPQLERAPPSVNRLLGKMMAKDPGDRYPGYGELLKDLIRLDRSGLLRDKILDDTGPVVAPQQASSRTPPPRVVPQGAPVGMRPSDIMTQQVDDEAVLLSQLDSAMKKSPSGSATAAPRRRREGSTLATKLVEKAKQVAAAATSPALPAVEDGEEQYASAPPRRYIVLGAGLLSVILVVALRPWTWGGGPSPDGPPPEVVKLRAMLEGADAATRQTIIRTLAGYPAEHVRGDLIGALKDESPLVRKEAVKALAAVEGPGAVPSIHSALATDGSPQVRETAARTLQQLTDWDFSRTNWRTDSQGLRKLAADKFIRWWRLRDE